MNIADNRVVSIHYRLTLDDGTQVDSSQEGSPLAYLQGASNILPALERELDGKAPGDEVAVTLQPSEGYGDVDPGLVQVVPHSAFEQVDDVQPGMRFEARDPNGQSQVITVREVGEQGVTVDANHPLAGEVLHFEISVEQVREATEEELEHGHVH